MSKTVLAIAYYFPPLGMGGVQRMAKLVKYLPQFGYDVLVLTVRPIRYPAHDATLLDELSSSVKVFRSGSSDPARIAKLVPLPLRAASRFKNIAKEKSSRFWPDSKIGWKRPALRLAAKLIASHNVNVVISSSPPITAHLVAMDIKNRFGIPWVADFRDPWESRPLDDVYRKKPLVEKSHRLLQRIVDTADEITSINNSISNGLSPSAATIVGGYDPDDFKSLPVDTKKDRFSLCYMGTVGPLHPIEPFFEAGQSAIGLNTEFKNKVRYCIIGANDKEQLESMAESYGLREKLEIIDYLPHRDALQKAASAAVSLISVPAGHPGILTGKIFDYLALPAPILAYVPSGGEIEKLIDTCRGGICVDYGQARELSKAILQLFNDHQQGLRWEKKNTSGYTRQEVANQFAGIFDRISNV
jgi:glycosyltransferase involved in cell wall biosynthesis